MQTFFERVLAVDANATIRAAILGAAIVVIVGVPLAFALNIWIDEAFTLHTTGAGLHFAWSQAIDFEDQPPLYFLVEAVWRTFDEGSVGFARIPSIIFAAAAVVAMVGAAHRMAPRVPPLIVALVSALHPLVLWAAVEMRVYALVLFLGAALTWTFFEAFLAAVPSRSARILYVVTAIAGIYTQYYVGFFIFAQMVTLACVRRGMLRIFLFSMGGVAVAFAAFVPIALKQVEAKDGFVASVTNVQAVHEVFNAIFSFVLPHDITWSGLPKVAGFLAAALLIGALMLAGRPARPVEAGLAVWLQLLVCGITFSAVLRLSGAPLDISSHFIVAAPLSLLTGLVFVTSLRRFQKIARVAAGLTFTIFCVGTLWTHYHAPLAKQGQWRDVAATLRTADQSIPVAAFPAELSLPLSWYYHRPTIPIPRAMPFTSDYVSQTSLRRESAVASVLDPVRARSQRLWIVTATACKVGRLGYYDYNCGYLETYLQDRYHLVKNVAFFGARARLFERSSIQTQSIHKLTRYRAGIGA